MSLVMTNYKVLLGLDIGTKYIGVAVGQAITKTATPLSSIYLKNQIPNWKALDKFIQLWKPDAIIIGLPQKIAGKNQTIISWIQYISKKIKERYQLPTFLSDETLTSVEARARLFAQKGYRNLSKENVDCYAAKLILEDWLTLNT
jgi:putative holliday junction resolvase